jgi:hypothetical protein
MQNKKYAEILNDTINYFLLADIQVLEKYKIENNLPDDLSNEFTNNDLYDKALEDGVVIAMAGIENYPYTIIFSLSNNSPELLKEGNQLQIRESGYILKVENKQIMLFTWRILHNFSKTKVEELLENYKKGHKAKIEIPNGWYEVEILGGLTLQNGDSEPTFEFLLTPSEAKPTFSANIQCDFKIELNN